MEEATPAVCWPTHIGAWAWCSFPGHMDSGSPHFLRNSLSNRTRTTHCSNANAFSSTQNCSFHQVWEIEQQQKPWKDTISDRPQATSYSQPFLLWSDWSQRGCWGNQLWAPANKHTFLKNMNIFVLSPSRSSWSDTDILYPSSTIRSSWGWSQHKRPSLYASVVLGISHRHFDVYNFSSNIKNGPSERKCGVSSGSKIICHLHYTHKKLTTPSFSFLLPCTEQYTL